MRDRDERDVVVPAWVGAAFEVIQAERVFELAVVMLDPPAQLGQADEILEDVPFVVELRDGGPSVMVTR